MPGPRPSERLLLRAAHSPLWGGPSFYRNLLRRRRVHYAARGSSKSPLWAWETKSGAKKLAAQADVLVPRTIYHIERPEELANLDLPERFVVKPDWGVASRGVMVLERVHDGFHELLTDRHISSEEFGEAVANRLQGQRESATGLIVEESLSVRRRLPFDWKVYTFYGHVTLTLQIERGTSRPRLKFYDQDWSDIGRIRFGQDIYPQLPLPRHPDRLRLAAEQVSLTLPTAFLRVDLYETEDNVLLGEVACRPGGKQIFRKGLDAAMGLEWEAAETRIIQAGHGLIP